MSEIIRCEKHHSNHSEDDICVHCSAEQIRLTPEEIMLIKRLMIVKQIPNALALMDYIRELETIVHGL